MRRPNRPSTPRNSRFAARTVIAVTAAAAAAALTLPAGLVVATSWATAATTTQTTTITSATTPVSHKSTPTVQSGHAPFGSCTATGIEMFISIPRTAYARGKNVNVTALIRNIGLSACSFERIGPIPAPGSPQANENVGMGPCGAMPLEVRNKKGTVVWPGVVFCPLLSTSGPGLEPGAQLVAKGTWNQEIEPGAVGKTGFHGSVGPAQSRAPRGTYSVVVDRAFTFHIRLR